MIGIASSGSFLVVALALCLWAAVGTWLLVPAVDNLRNLSRTLNHRELVTASGETVRGYVRNFSDDERPTDPRAGELVEAVVRILLALGLFVLGLALLTAVLPAGQIAALIFGPVFLAAAWVLSRLYRRQRALWRRRAPAGRLSEGGHGAEVLMYIVGVIALATMGILIMAVAL